MEFNQFAKESLDFIRSLKRPALEEAKALFPHHPKAQYVWVKLCSMDGGIMPVVETLGLRSEYREYLKDVEQIFEKGLLDTVSMQIEGFVEFCKQRVLEEFYMFK